MLAADPSSTAPGQAAASASSPSAAPAGATPQPVKIGPVTVSGSLRMRLESWDWFAGDANNEYRYLGSVGRLSFSQSAKRLDWQFDLAAPFILGMPGDAIAPGVQGQLGLGANYYASNNRRTNVGFVFPKQGFLRFKRLNGTEGQAFKIGRMEVIDGTETVSRNATLAAVKRERIAHRLLGSFAFSQSGRSFDGAQYTANGSKLNLTLFSGRPTRGVYQVDGWGDLNVTVFYGALTGQIGSGKSHAGEWRLLGLGYTDYRDGVLKVDNRPLAARRADTAHINIGTYGGHYLHTVTGKAGTADFLIWGMLQNGSFGTLTHRASAIVAEAGFQPAIARRLRPWIRSGYNRGSGDGNPNDSRHNTFFQVLPTPRTYARMPFFNLMNARDAFGELILRPAKSLTIRSDVHSLRLANANDLWYSGGGAYQPWTFGYTGRVANGAASLATLFDTSAEYNVNAHLTLGAYYGYANGKAVTQTIYPKDKNGSFGYLEMTWRF
jgi:hypothetical protein